MVVKGFETFVADTGAHSGYHDGDTRAKEDYDG